MCVEEKNLKISKRQLQTKENSRSENIFMKWNSVRHTFIFMILLSGL